MRVVTSETKQLVIRVLSAHVAALFFSALSVLADSPGAAATPLGSAIPTLSSAFSHLSQAQSRALNSCGLLSYGSDDLLPPGIQNSGAKIQPTVTPPSAYDDSNHNGHHHMQGYGNGSNQGSGNMQGYGQGYGTGGGGYGYGQGYPGGFGHQHHGRHHQNNGQYGSGNQSFSTGSASSAAANIKTWNSGSQNSAPQSTQGTGAFSSQKTLPAVNDQTNELERTYAREAQAKISRIHQEAAATRQSIQAQVTQNNQQSSFNVRGRGSHGRGMHGNNGSNKPTYDQQRQLTQSSAFEQKSVESIEQNLREKQLAIHNSASLSRPSTGTMKNDLHVQNYEITDTPSGAEIPLIATPKSLKSVH